MTLKKTIFLLFVIFLPACRNDSPVGDPPNIINVSEASPDSFITLKVNEVEILSNNGELIGEREFRLLVVGSDQSGHSASLTCPAKEAIPIRVGKKLSNPCPFGISIAEDEIEGDLFYLIVALDEDEVNGAADFGIEVLLTYIAGGVVEAVRGSSIAKSLPLLSAGGPVAVGGYLLLETAVGYGGGKLVDYGLQEDEIGVQALRLRQQDNWFAGDEYEIVSADGNMRLVFSIHQTQSPEANTIIIDSDETEIAPPAQSQPVKPTEEIEVVTAVSEPVQETPTEIAIEPTNPGPNQVISSGWQQGRLVFLRDQSAGKDLYTLNLGNGGQTQLLASLPTNALTLGPLWSPNGQNIVLYDTVGKLYFVDPANGAVTTLSYECTSPSWSPNGQQILCHSVDPATFDIIDAGSGSLVRQISRPPRANIPLWSPDGNEIVFAVFDDSETRETSIWRMSLDDPTPVLLTNIGNENYAPAWSPDGQWIAYQSTNDDSNSEIWIMDRNGNNARRLTNTSSGSWSRAPFWSPDGKWIAFVSDQHGGNGSESGEIFVVSVENGEIHQVTTTGGNVYNWRISWTE